MKKKPFYRKNDDRWDNTYGNFYYMNVYRIKATGEVFYNFSQHGSRKTAKDRASVIERCGGYIERIYTVKVKPRSSKTPKRDVWYQYA